MNAYRLLQLGRRNLRQPYSFGGNQFLDAKPCNVAFIDVADLRRQCHRPEVFVTLVNEIDDGMLAARRKESDQQESEDECSKKDLPNSFF